MGVPAVRFDGKDLYRPGYYARRRYQLANTGAASGSRLLVIGSSEAGVPYNATTAHPNADDRVNWVSSLEEIQALIRGGPGYYGCLFALTPSGDAEVNGAPAAGFIRINEAVQGAKTILDTEAGNLLDIKSVDYGLYTNGIRFKIIAGTVKGKQMIVKFEDQTITGDDLAYELFSIQYTGNGTTAVLTLDPAGSIVVTIAGQSDGTTSLSMSLATYTNVGDLVAAINAQAGYSASTVGDSTFPTAQLDKVLVGDAVSVKTSAYTVKAIVQAMIDWINGSSAFLTCALSSGAVRRPPVNITSYTYLASGSDGSAPTQTQWDGALTLAKLIDASFVCVLTNDAAVAASLGQHVTDMNSSVGSNERQGFWGCASGDNKAAKLADAQVSNHYGVDYYGDIVKRYDKSGVLTEFDGFYGACMIAGLQAGNDLNFSPTNKSLNVVAVREKYSSTDVDDLIKGGVIIAQPADEGGIKVVRAVTTYQGANLILNESSMVREALWVTKDHRTYVKSVIGRPGTATNMEAVNNLSKTRLDRYEDLGVFVQDPALGNAWRSYTFEVVGDTFKISYEGTLVSPINFVLVTHNFTVVGATK